MSKAVSITGCADCPMLLFDRDEWAVCRHPDSEFGNYLARACDDLPSVAPYWCPLRESPLEIRLVTT